MIDETHEASLKSFVGSADGHPEFPIQNLPLGVFRPDGEADRGGVAIGDEILDLKALASSGLLDGEAQAAADAASGQVLNPLLALGAGPRRALRRRLSALLAEGSSNQATVAAMLRPAAACEMMRPARIGDYTDFYAGIHHAENVGRQFRPDNPLLPNYKHVPIGYHGRASSIRVSGARVRRPSGQRKAADAQAPMFGPSERLDYELELGVWIAGGNRLGQPIPIGEAGAQVAGLCLLNDWSARDLQAWEYQPLGPFLAKNFMTTISPWIVTAEALAPFRLPQPPRPEGDPPPLPYLFDAEDQARGAFSLQLEASIRTAAMRKAGTPPFRLGRTQASNLYWTVAQLVAHHASGGCNLRPGDLLGTGTISGPDPGTFGSLLESSEGGKTPLSLPTGETRSFLQEGDELTLSGRAVADGYVAIGFGACSGIIAAGD